MADAAQLEASRVLWDAVAELNREFAAQREIWLSPTAALDYEIEIQGARTSRVPVLTHLKQTHDGVYLVAVNVDENSVSYRVLFPDAPDEITRIAGNGSARLADGRDRWCSGWVRCNCLEADGPLGSRTGSSICFLDHERARTDGLHSGLCHRIRVREYLCALARVWKYVW